MKHLAGATLLAAAALIGCGGSENGSAPDSPSGPAEAKLAFEFRAEPGAEPKRVALTCPGDDPASLSACRDLNRVPPGTFDPVPPGTACTEIYGGPQTVRVTGRLAGREIESLFSRVNGCEISRWGSLSPVLESLGLERVGAALPR